MFNRMLHKIPYIGNLVKVQYLRQSLPNHNFTVCEAMSVRLFFRYTSYEFAQENFPGQYGAFVITPAELSEAHMRFVKYVGKLPNKMLDIPIGKFVIDYPIQTDRPGKPFLKFHIIFFHQNGERWGYMFTKNDLNAIFNRSLRLANTIKTPKWWQKIILFFHGLK